MSLSKVIERLRAKGTNVPKTKRGRFRSAFIARPVKKNAKNQSIILVFFHAIKRLENRAPDEIKKNKRVVFPWK